MLGIALQVAGRGARGIGGARLQALRGHLEHLRAEIEAGGFRAAAGEGLGDVAGAAAEVQSLLAGADGGQFHDAPLPAPVEAEALEIVDQVVTAGDAREQVVDLGGALLAGDVIGVAHSQQ